MAEIRLLKEQNISSFFYHRLEGLKLVPTAFGGTFEDENLAGPSRWEPILQKADPSNVIYGAFDDNQIVGCIGIFQETGRKSRHKAMIWGMYVKKTYQGRGLGKKLVLKAIEHAGTIPGINLINLSVESSNTAAKKLYESCGFESWGKEPRALFVGSQYYDEDHMYLSLREKIRP